MIILRILLLAFNVAAFAYLVYQLLQIYRSQHPYKGWIIGIGVLLLIAPVAILAGALRSSPSYLFLYPLALSVFIYFIRTVR
jgi:hypothetical protein